MKWTLRDYQKKACRAVVDSFAGKVNDTIFTKVIIHGSTGCGKTVMGSALTEYWVKKEGVKTLMICDSDELCDQSLDKLEQSTGIIADLEKAKHYASKRAQAVVGSIQTLEKTGRLHGFEKNHFGYIFADECFIAGTMVATPSGNRPIEKLASGDCVAAYNPRTKNVEFKPVRAIKKSVPSNLVKINTGHGRAVTATPTHPIFANGAYKPCHELAKGDNLVTYEIHEEKRMPDLREEVGINIEEYLLLNGMQAEAGGETADSMPAVRKTNSICAWAKKILAKRWKTLLCKWLRSKSDKHREPGVRPTFKIQQRVRRAKNAPKKPNDESGIPGKNESVPGTHRPSAKGQRGERSRSNEMRINSWGSYGIERKCDCPDWLAEGGGVSQPLQIRLGGYESEIGCGGGRTVSLPLVPAGSGQEKERLPGRDWVESVEVLKPSGDGEFGGMCPGGFVYNIEVEGLNNYFANGILVHNCHLAMADTWQRVLNYFHEGGAKIVGLTATPERGDKQSLMRFFEHVAAVIPMAELITKRQLTPIVVETVPLEVKITCTITDGDSDAVGEELEAYYSAIIDAIEQRAAERKKILIFHSSVKASMKFTSMLRTRGHTASHVDGDSKDRREIITGFRKSHFRILNNRDLLIKGFDAEDIDCILILRPTRGRTPYIQMVGRGTRLYCPHGCKEWCDHPDRKQNLLLLDLLWEFADHDVMGPADLLTDAPQQKKELAKKLKEGGKLDLLGADAFVTGEREADLLAKLKRQSGKTGTRVDALAFAALLHQPGLLDYEPVSHWHHLPVSPAQADALESIGVDPASLQDRGHASMIMEAVVEQRTKGLATPKQVLHLTRAGVQNAHRLSFRAACDMLDNIFSKR